MDKFSKNLPHSWHLLLTQMFCTTDIIIIYNFSGNSLSYIAIKIVKIYIDITSLVQEVKPEGFCRMCF